MIHKSMVTHTPTFPALHVRKTKYTGINLAGMLSGLIFVVSEQWLGDTGSFPVRDHVVARSGDFPAGKLKAQGIGPAVITRRT